MKKIGSVSLSLCLAFVLLLSGQAIAAESTAAKTYEIRLKVGAETVKINGEAVKVQKIYKDKTTVMAPISVITRAFGAVLTWDPKAQTIGLKYSSFSVQMKVGSNQAVMNGKKVTLTALPKMVNNVVMIPIQVVSEAFGAKVTTDTKTAEMVIKGTLANVTAPVSTPINPDAGKTRIGDSFYKWSIKYPSGLVKNSQSFKEDWVSFSDAKGEYTLVVDVEAETNVTLSKAALLKNLGERIDGTILEKKTVTEANKSYARVLSKNNDGSYSEDRAHFSQGYIYYVYLTVNKAENYKNAAKYKGYKDILDSFQMVFDVKAKTIKDISTVKNGYRLYSNVDHALSFNLPSDWEADEEGLYFYKGDYQYLSIVITSISEGDTLERWVARDELKFSEEYAADYGKSLSVTAGKTAGVPSLKKVYEYTAGDKWRATSEIYFFKGKYKYYFTLGYLKENASENLTIFNKIQKSILVDSSKIDSSFGVIEDEQETVDKTATLTKVNKEFKYQLVVPELWSDDTEENDEESFTFSFKGGSFTVYADATSTMQANVNYLHTTYEEAAELNPDFKAVETDESLLGFTARKFVVTNKDQGVPFTNTQYILSRNNVTYFIVLIINDWAATDVNKKRLEDALNSFTFTE